jgi:hypothetical protein
MSRIQATPLINSLGKYHIRYFTIPPYDRVPKSIRKSQAESQLKVSLLVYNVIDPLVLALYTIYIITV